jgi:hypothetical protein
MKKENSAGLGFIKPVLIIDALCLCVHLRLKEMECAFLFKISSVP